jgi:hypothetical protein
MICFVFLNAHCINPVFPLATDAIYFQGVILRHFAVLARGQVGPQPNRKANAFLMMCAILYQVH